MQKKNNDNILLFSTEKRARFDDNFYLKLTPLGAPQYAKLYILP